jgi:hypothetical protein
VTSHFWLAKVEPINLRVRGDMSLMGLSV